MTLTIHRGTHEIGGSCVEIRTDKTKILIDLGMPLDYDKHNTEEQTEIRHNAKEWCKGVDALFLSHAHADHYGFLGYCPKIHLFTPPRRPLRCLPSMAFSVMTQRNTSKSAH